MPGGDKELCSGTVLKFPFPSIVISSEDDEYISIERAAFFANCWSSEFVNIGKRGHINSASNIGESVVVWAEREYN